MNNIQKINLLLKDISNSIELELLHQTIVDLMVEYNQDYSEFDLRVSDYYINYLKNIFGENISVVRSKTGFTKNRVIKGFKKDLIQKTDFFKKQKNLLVEACNLINSYCYQNKTDKMPKIKLYSLMQTFTDGKISIKAHLDRLIETGFLKCINEFIYIDLESPRKIRKQDDYLRLIVEGFFRLLKTVNFNKNNKDGSIQLFERRLRTTQIPPSVSNEVSIKINETLGDCYKQIKNLLSSYEEDVPSDTYKEITVHFIHFNQFLIEEIPNENNN